ncbi:MAG TPA: M23 family peptidase [Opitutae bacterium]|nr:peptidase M23 [Puniceicoccaceae bacterium]HBR93287.1 M23 family peptidase [Opitutae bacterium]|tara:strand:+ start:1633 stop:2637 length:1005 start_codon:yes stop_codon:yes gene_type:complete
MRRQQIFLLLALLVPLCVQANLIWPTPNPAFQNGESIEAFIQPTVSGIVESGLFGCVRNSGHRFHEGLDLYPVKRDRSGEPLDPVYAVLPGKVVHASRVPGHSSYGRYVVIQHDREVPSYHTLYAHLASVADGVVPGARVEAGSVLGIMGRSATYSIPTSRAHVHFEVGFRLTDDFQTWYDRKKFGNKNQHGSWNGMNLVSVDPLAFYQAIRNGSVKNLYEHLQHLPAAARIRVYSARVPSFVKDYPALLTKPFEGQSVVAWDIAFTKYGVPKEWTPRFASDNLAGKPGDVKVIAYNPSLLDDQTCRRVLNVSGSRPAIASGTISTIKKLFGFK